MKVEIAAFEAPGAAHFNQPTGPAGIVTRLAVAEAALIEVQQRDGKGGGGQGSITWKWSS